MEEARIDKWLWASRIFKTRTIAADACKNGRVTIEGVNVKPSRMVKVGETVSVRKPPITYSFRILKTIEPKILSTTISVVNYILAKIKSICIILIWSPRKLSTIAIVRSTSRSNVSTIVCLTITISRIHTTKPATSKLYSQFIIFKRTRNIK